MGRGRIAGFPAVAAISLAGAFASWYQYPSTLYPYSIKQPSAFAHIVLHDTYDHSIDYWFPSLGTFTTNLNVFARPGRKVTQTEELYLRSVFGHHVHRIGWIRLAGQRLPLIRGDFKGLIATWREEGVTFAARGFVWRLNISYDIKYTNLRSTLLRMLLSFRLRG